MRVLLSLRTSFFALAPFVCLSICNSYVAAADCSEWTEEAVSRAEVLRLIYQGRFLHGNVTLGGKETRKRNGPSKIDSTSSSSIRIVRATRLRAPHTQLQLLFVCDQPRHPCAHRRLFTAHFAALLLASTASPSTLPPLRGMRPSAALQLPLGRTSVMHLVPRENLPEPNSQGKLRRHKLPIMATVARTSRSLRAGLCYASFTFLRAVMFAALL